MRERTYTVKVMEIDCRWFEPILPTSREHDGEVRNVYPFMHVGNGWKMGNVPITTFSDKP
jgi:hypothetical protein